MFPKYFIIVTLLNFVVNINSEETSNYYATEFLECAHKLLRYGVWDWDLPSFDPLIDERPYIDFDNLHIPDIISGRLNMAFGIVEGIPYFTIQNISETITNNTVDIKTTLSFNRLAAHTEYKGKVYLFKKLAFYGDGFIKLELFDSYVDMHFMAEYHNETNEDKWRVNKFDFIPHIGSATVKLTGLYNNETLSQNITDVLQQDGVDVFNSLSWLINFIFNIGMKLYLNLMKVTQLRLEEVMEMMFIECT